MKTLLTGYNGFVGRHLLNAIRGIPLKDSLGLVDITNKKRVESAVSSIAPDQVIHLAAQSFIPASFQDPLETYTINFIGTFNLLEALKASGFSGNMLYVGSAEVYGLVPPNQLPVSETQPLRPRNPYAVSKIAAEALCYQMSQTGSFSIVMARPFNHIGPGQDQRFVVSDFARQIIEIKQGKKEPLLEVGEIEVTRDFTDVEDVIGAYLGLLENGKSGEVYNVCSGKERSVRSIIETLLHLAGVRVEIISDLTRFRPSEQRRMCGNPQKIRTAIGWEPRVQLEDTLLKILEDWTRKVE